MINWEDISRRMMMMTIGHDDAMLVKMEKVRRRILCRQDLGRKSVPNFEDRDKSVTFKNEDFGWFTWVLKTRLIEKKNTNLFC